ncbi:HNH endonuclease signature motif containing protein [Microbacterium sp. BK668]|uniref:HNH endonuclease signature motif containing protein n=1 Tax=Microbacterium sp. BK668 TaxID=2512118 RepID=UPI00105BF667|nr:HNH endonuclease signature motif containing protein [Microbacterium sp. BK668]
MNSLADAVRAVGGELASIAEEALGEDRMRLLADAEVLEVMALAARVHRAAEALLLESTAHVADRSEGAGPDRLTTRAGCRSVSELVQRATRLSSRSATDLVTAARAMQRQIAPSSGELLPALLPAMRDALGAASVGVDGIVAVASPLRGCPAGREAILAADEELAAAARGERPDAAPPASADDLRALATVWAVYLDPDGVEPREARAMRKRGLALGACREGLVPLRGALLPEVAAQLQRIFDSLLNPKIDRPAEAAGPTFRADDDQDEPHSSAADTRTRAQRQHDALATTLAIAAASGKMPHLGGAAPTLVISVRAEDLEQNRGVAHVSGCDEPVSLGVARHIACAGAVQRAKIDASGRIVRLGTPDRVFNHHQRRAISLRDGGCIIPGCHVPAAWCEVHHVRDHALGGPTHTDNGVLLCWFHHRTLDTSGWQIRMTAGVPEVRGPYWWDAHMRWRPATKSPTRMRDRVVRRM